MPLTRSRKIQKRPVAVDSDSAASLPEEEAEDSCSSEMEAPSYTVSSRGRVRKLTERARALYNKN